jgi:solute carrier family 10 (sodium/bile acid cotransporter), member 7
MKRFFDGFLLALALAIGLAWIAPGPGSEDGWLHPKILTKVGVALIFFLHGANLSFTALKAGTLRWPLHLVIQLSTFLLFPLLGLAGLWLAGNSLSPELGLGLFFLCALPSTVSSSVAMTALARGNVAAAVFNATLSSLIGVFLTPFWIALVLKAEGGSLPLGSVILDLVLWLILPLLIGHAMRPWLGAFIHRHKKGLHLVDRGVILLIVYTSFCDSVSSGVWQGKGWDLLGITLGVSVGLFFVVMAVMQWVCRILKFPIEDRIAGVFCGSKKSLAVGVPMAQIIFAGNPALGLILLPIIVYHSFQLAVCAWLARRWSLRKL